MRTNKAILAGALIAPMLALGGGLAYATTTSGSPPPATRTAVTSTVQTQHQNTSQAHHNRCYSPGRGNHPCDLRGRGYQRQPAGQPSQRHPAHRHAGYRHHHGYGGQRGDWGYRGSGYYGTGYGRSHCGGCCGSGW